MTETKLQEARRHVETLKAYYLARGVKINAWVEPYRKREGGRTVTYYEIKSDLGAKS